LYREIIAVYSEIHTKHTNTLCGENVEFFYVKPHGTRTYVKYEDSFLLVYYPEWLGNRFHNLLWKFWQRLPSDVERCPRKEK